MPNSIRNLLLPFLTLNLLALLGPSFISAGTWTEWTKRDSNPVYSHSGTAASDPAVIKDGSLYRMVVSGNGGGSPDGNSLIMATSPDGYTWSTLSNGNDGIVVPSAIAAWDESLETPELIKQGSEYLLFYTGYDPAVRDASGGRVWGDLGLATSTDGVSFTRHGAPVLTRTPNSHDQDGITDPSIVELNGTLHMIYVGWCTQSCAQNGGDPAFYVLKAVSTDGGLSWTKQGRLDPSSNIGLQHPDLVLDDDGSYSLFYGEDAACSSGRVGILRAQGSAPFGPFSVVSSTPILCMGTQSFETDGLDGGFPSVLNDNGIGRMYYTGVNVPIFKYEVGLAETGPMPEPPPPPEDPTSLAPKGYPNPFKPSPGIPFTLSGLTPGKTTKIFTILGYRVVELPAANSEGKVQWNGKNDAGQTVASGVYIAVFKKNGDKETLKIVVQK